MIFGIFKDKGAENIASTINEQYNKLYSLAKKDKVGMHVINRSIFEKEYRSYDLKITKKFAKWIVPVEGGLIRFATEPKNKDEIYAALQGICSTHPMCALSIMCFSANKRDKNVICIEAPNNERGIAVKDILVKKYGFNDKTT